MSYRQNFKEKIELAKMSKAAAGLVSEHYSGVSRIVFHMTYYQSAMNRLLMTRTLNFYPADFAYFHMDCMRDECVNGGFDLTPIVAEMVKNHKNSKKGRIFCDGKKPVIGPAGASHYHASLSYEINIEYNKQAK
jgi:hypothetical protein